MAGQTDAPDKTVNPEQNTAQSLVQGDTLNAYRNPGQPQPNADRPGAPTPAAGAQDGGAAVPPGDAAALAATPARTDSTATAAAPAAGSDSAAAATPRAGADTGVHTHDAPGPAPNALDVMNRVNAILDGDVPKLNKAHDLAGAEKAYEAAINLANQLTPADIAKAQQDLVEVRKEKAQATDPTTQRDLANKEVELYTITRLKDAALGNEALWYYRQGKTEQGNERLLEACGVDPATADKIKKLDAPGINAFAQVLQSEANPPTILGDTNFYRQINKINEGGGQVPALFGKLHEKIVQDSTAAASGNGAGAGAGSDTAAGAQAGHDSGAGRTTDNTAGKPSAPFDAAATAAAMGKFVDTALPLADKPGPLSADQRATLEAGVKAFDAQNTAVGSAMDQLHQVVAKSGLTADQQTALGKASLNIDAELQKVADANNHKVPDAVSAQVDAFVKAGSPADAQAAIAALNQSAPGVGKAIQDEVKIMPADAKGLKGAQLIYASHRVEQLFVDTSAKQFDAHALYAHILLQTKTPSDPTDAAHAKEVFLAGVNNVPKQVIDAEMQRPDNIKLAQQLGLTDASKPAGTGTGAGTDSGKPAPGAGTDNTAGAGTDAGAAPKTGLAAIKDADLMRELNDAQKKGPAGFDETKALYGEAIRRVEDPAARKEVTDVMTSNLTALESGKNADGSAVTSDQRTKMHVQNLEIIDQLSAAAQLHSQYAAYLGANKQSQSQDVEQRKAIAAADSIDPNLLKREDAQLNKDRANNAGDLATLNQAKVLLEGGKDASGNVQPSLMNLRVSMRDDLAVLYLKEGLQLQNGQVVTKAVSGKNTDSGFKPQDAQQLLTDARAANETLNGKGAKDAETEQLYALGHSIQPDVFKNEGQALKNAGAGVVSDAAAFFGSQAGRFLLASGIAGLDAATEGRLKVNPMMAYGIGTAGAIGSGILTRHFTQKLLTGQDESWTDSAVHGTAVALAPEAFKAGAKYIPMGWEKIGGGLLSRSSEMTSEGVLQNVGRAIGPNATPSEIASVFERGGMPKEAEAIRALGSKAAVTPEDIAALNLDGSRGTEALAKLNQAKAATAREVAIADHLGSDGMNVKTVGDLSKLIERENGELADLQTQVKGLSDARAVGDSTPIRTALKKLTDPAGKPYFSTDAELDQGTSVLKGYGINNVGDLAKRTPFTMQEAFPQLAGAPPETSLTEAARNGIVFGDTKSVGRNLIENVELPDAKLPDVPGPAKHGFLQLLKGPRDAFLKPLVAHNVDLGVDISRGAAGATDGNLANRLLQQAKAARPSIGFHTPSVDMPDAYWTKLSTASTDAQINTAASQLRYWRSAAGTGAGFGLYNTTTDVYDKYVKHEQYRDASGNLKDYTLGDALASAAERTAIQAVTNAMLFEGAVAPTFESGAASSGFVGRSLSSFGKVKMPLAVVGINAVAQGYPNYSAGVDKLNVYNNTQRPLQDVPLYQNVGTTADVLAARRAAQAAPAPADNTAPAAAAPQAPGQDVPQAPAPAAAAPGADHAAGPPITDPTADSIPTPEQINQDQPVTPKPVAKPAAPARPAASAAPAPAPAPAVRTSSAAPPNADLGSDAPPGQV